MDKQPHSLILDIDTQEWIPYPTEVEFIKYLLDELPLMGDVLNVNRHFAAQYTQCPFCSLPFDFIGKKEHFNDDIKVLFNHVNLTDKCDISMVKNGVESRNEEFQTLEFFKRIPHRLSSKVFKYYELDFDLFGYDKNDAMKYIEAGYNDTIEE